MATRKSKTKLSALHDAIRAEMRQSTKDIIRDQRQSLLPIQRDLTDVRDQLRGVHTKLDAIMSGEVLVTRQQLQRLFKRLEAQGITLDEREIFAS